MFPNKCYAEAAKAATRQNRDCLSLKIREDPKSCRAFADRYHATAMAECDQAAAASARKKAAPPKPTTPKPTAKRASTPKKK